MALESLPAFFISLHFARVSLQGRSVERWLLLSRRSPISPAGRRSLISSTGRRSLISSTGRRSLISSAGRRSLISSAGRRSLHIFRGIPYLPRGDVPHIFRRRRSLIVLMGDVPSYLPQGDSLISSAGRRSLISSAGRRSLIPSAGTSLYLPQGDVPSYPRDFEGRIALA